MIYTCQRCGYVTEFTSNFKKHINAKKTCEPSLTDISKEQLLTDFLETQNDKEFICNQCNKKYKTVETLRVHKKTCTSHNENNTTTDTNATKNNTTTDTTSINNQVVREKIKQFLYDNIECITDYIIKFAKIDE